MKVIDLLNKIANGEEVPKKIKVNNKYEYEYDYGIDYKAEDGIYLFDSYIEITKEDMNMEVEIIEDTPKEDKKIEKLKTYKEIDDEEHFANFLQVSKNGEYEIDEAMSVVIDKINEIIDKINGE